MSVRLCGYCRLDGHRVNTCPTKKLHRDTILKHTPMERLFLLNTLVKNGLGLGATFLTAPYWSSTPAVVTLIDAEWVSKLHFCDMKKMKYSKQVKIVAKNSFERIGDSIMNADTQYGSFVINGFTVHEGTSAMQDIHINYRRLLEAFASNGESTETHSGRIVIASRSYEPFPNMDEVLTANVKLHRRLATPDEISKMYRYDDYASIKGILPVQITSL